MVHSTKEKLDRGENKGNNVCEGKISRAEAVSDTGVTKPPFRDNVSFLVMRLEGLKATISSMMQELSLMQTFLNQTDVRPQWQ